MFLQTVAAMWIVAALVPGPNFLTVARCALSGADGSALGCVAGVALGTLCWGLAGWLGVSALFAAAPIAYLALKVGGGLYLIGMGLRLLWTARKRPGAPSGPSSPGRLTRGQAFRLGLTTNLANPKTALFVASLFATALPHDASRFDGLAAVALMVAISTIWYSFLSLALSRGPLAALYGSARRWIDAAAGAFFIGFGAKLMTAARA